jgi:hypothetical protein
VSFHGSSILQKGYKKILRRKNKRDEKKILYIYLDLQIGIYAEELGVVLVHDGSFSLVCSSWRISWEQDSVLQKKLRDRRKRG